MIARNKKPIQTGSGTGLALSGQKWQNPTRVLVSYRTFPFGCAFRPDMGGGDLVFPDYAREREIVAMLADARAAIDPVAIHLILPTASDLAVLERMEGDGLFTPAATILALNAGPVGDTRPAEVVFRRVRETAIYQTAIARGAREIVVPTLGCMNLVDDAGLSFEQAMARNSPLGLAHRQMVATFRRRLYAELDKVTPWLP